MSSLPRRDCGTSEEQLIQERWEWHQGEACPLCGEFQFVEQGPPSGFAELASQEIGTPCRCKLCGHAWINIWELAGWTEMQDKTRREIWPED